MTAAVRWAGLLLLVVSTACGSRVPTPQANPAAVEQPQPAAVLEPQAPPADAGGAAPVQAPAPAERRSARNQRMTSARLAIPVIGVQAPLVELGLNRDRTLEVPRSFDVAGWYRGGPAPGEAGPAIVVGHVSSRGGPAVFARLGELRPGDGVSVTYPDGGVARFVVDAVEQHAKEAFPTERVYGNTTGSELRLITCGGRWDAARRTHRDNIIVFATDARRAGAGAGGGTPSAG